MSLRGALDPCYKASSRPRRGAWSEYWSKISGAASSSMILGFQGLPQNPSNQRPTTALLSCSPDIFDPLDAGDKGVPAFRRGVSTSCIGVVDTRILRFDSDTSREVVPRLLPDVIRLARPMRRVS